MKHRKKINSLSSHSHKRVADLKNLSLSILRSEGYIITTTLARAKAFTVFFEKKYITKVKKMGDTIDRSKMINMLMGDNQALNDLVKMCQGELKNRQGGYTSIVKLPARQGDAAPMAAVRIILDPVKA